MYNFIEKDKILYNKQFGFRQRHSTSHALISLTMTRQELQKYVLIWKRLSTPQSHKILCEKLRYYGFRGKINDLIKSFLSNRKQ